MPHPDWPSGLCTPGSKPPLSSCVTATAEPFSSREALRRGPIVLVFYRGRWCPYCNTDLCAIEAASHDIRSLGASLVAVSQQTPENSRETRRRNGLSFASLVDAGGKVAHAFGLCWKVSDELRAVEGGCGMDRHRVDKLSLLPLAAVTQ